MEKVKKEIKEAKGKFFKRLSKTIFDERVESYHLTTLKQKNFKMGKAFEDSCTIPISKTRHIFNYKTLNELLAIYRVIEGYYEKDLINYHPEDVVELCKFLHKKTIKSFWSTMDEKIGKENYPKYQISQADAYKELVYRGFKPNRLLSTPKGKNEYYIHNVIFGLVHPMVIKDMPTAQLYQGLLGIMGHTGYFDPNRK